MILRSGHQHHRGLHQNNTASCGGKQLDLVQLRLQHRKNPPARRYVGQSHESTCPCNYFVTWTPRDRYGRRSNSRCQTDFPVLDSPCEHREPLCCVLASNKLLKTYIRCSNWTSWTSFHCHSDALNSTQPCPLCVFSTQGKCLSGYGLMMHLLCSSLVVPPSGIPWWAQDQGTQLCHIIAFSSHTFWLNFSLSFCLSSPNYLLIFLSFSVAILKFSLSPSEVQTRGGRT